MSDTLTAATLVQESPAGASRFIWYELMTSDQDAAIRFYSQVVGWTAADHDDPQMSFRYTILSAGGQGVAGLMQLTDAMCEGGARPGWFGYVGVPDVDAKTQEVEATGGRVLMQPDDIPNVGRFSFVTDPGGAPFYLMTPLPRDSAPAFPDRDAIGGFNWHELYSSLGQKAAFDFYSRLFGWETLQAMDMGPLGTYRIFGTEGEQFGGMVDKPENIPVSTWGYYINVDSIDAAIDRIKAGGGQIVMGPHQVPDGNWIVQASDTQGAYFALTAGSR
jgi:predicted enzyme related to lactoylglutathione lyase